MGPLPEEPAPDAPTDVPADPPSQPEPAARLSIVVGHTALRPGARAVAPISESEYFWNSHLAELMEAAAAEQGIETLVCFRDQGGIDGAYARAAAFQPDAIIELHFNSYSETSTGTETLYADGNDESKRLAEVVQTSMLESLGRRDRGPKGLSNGDRGFRNVSAQPNIPSVLVEPFFGSNPSDCQAAHASKEAYANGLVRAVKTFVA